nr:hypothetical protein [uncultured Porphyromonas sp.]
MKQAFPPAEAPLLLLAGQSAPAVAFTSYGRDAMTIDSTPIAVKLKP